MPLKTFLVAAALAIAVAAPAAAQQPPTLYKRLGGYDAIAAVTDEFLARLSTDPGFARFFGGHSTDSLNKFSVPAKDKDDVLGAVSALKKDIVEKP